QILQVDLQRGRIHRHQHRGLVARSENPLTGKIQLKATDAGQGPRRGANLRWKIGQGRDVVARHRGLGGELHAGQLHAVAGVAGETDYKLGAALDRFMLAGRAGLRRKRLGRLRWYSHWDVLSSSDRTLNCWLLDGMPWEAPASFDKSAANS